MPRVAKPLADTQVKRAKSPGTLSKLFGGDGLYLELHPNGAKNWHFRYKRENDNEQLLSFGSYPEMRVAVARHVGPIPSAFCETASGR